MITFNERCCNLGKIWLSGGLRFSDRKEDFRTEVLGLMSAQMLKNAVIVPEGSKGGFVIEEKLAKHKEIQLLELEEVEKKDIQKKVRNCQSK